MPRARSTDARRQQQQQQPQAGGGSRPGRQWRSRSRSRGRPDRADADGPSVGSDGQYQHHHRHPVETSAEYGTEIESVDHNSNISEVRSTAATVGQTQLGGFVTSPPPRKAGLTGNISSLFRRSSGRDNHQQQQQQQQPLQQQQQQGGGDRRSHSSNNNIRRQGPKIVDAGHSPRSKSQSKQQSQKAQSQQEQQIVEEARRSLGRELASASAGRVGRNPSRLFYSGADDDDSEDSFESRYSRASGGGGGGGSPSHKPKARTRAAPSHDGTETFYTTDGDEDDDMGGRGRGADESGSTYTGVSGMSREPSMASSTRHGRSGFFSNSDSGYTGSVSTDGVSHGGNGGGGGGGFCGFGWFGGGNNNNGNNSSIDSKTGRPKGDGSTTILRYRGFSTSIKSLFLDEALVCASMGCFGLILSNRTEHLLQLRNDRRGVQWGSGSGGKASSPTSPASQARRTLPSRIVAYALLLTLLLIGITFVVWGFGSSHGINPFRAADQFYGGRSNNSKSGGNNNGNNNNNNGNQYSAYDDVYNNANNDDNSNNGNGANDDNYNNNNNAAANDDNNGNNNNDDANNNNNNNNDDGNGNDAAAQNDDGNAAAAVDDAYYAADNDDGGRNRWRRRRRHLDRKGGLSATATAKAATPPIRPHRSRINGIFKVRDMREGLWDPAVEFLSDEWYRPNERPQPQLQVQPRGQQQLLQQQQKQQQQQQHHRQHQHRHHRSKVRTLQQGGGQNSSGSERDLASDLRISLIIAFLIVLGILGRRRRMRTRYYLVRARAQEDHLFYASSGTGIKRVGFQDSREDQYEGACSHTLCGCYPTDPPREGDEVDDEVRVSDEGVSQRKKRPHNEDCVGRGFNCLLGLCCGVVCKCWFQCLSICALAQEAREIRLLVPTRFQRVDYITHQPFHEYQKDVNDLRRGWLGKTRKKSGIMPHLNALSRLARYILAISSMCLLAIVGTLLFNPRASFSWPDAVILLATILQSFLVLWVVHWIFHKSDLSLDAVVKFFAAGFVIAVPSAFFFEGMLVNIILLTASLGFWLGRLIGDEAFVSWVVQHYRLLWILGEIFNAYVVAAVTEELCKYYTFRCVEHPDLIFLTGLVSSAQDERAHEGGVVKYPFSSHQVQKTNQAKNPYDDDASVHSHRSKSSAGGRNTSLDPNPSEEEFYEDDHDVRTHRQRAAAVTTAMISVAVGLACAENFLYVFLLGGTGSENADPESAGGYLEEWIVLLFRSIFPVHALAAAMQSINMVRKFVETDDVNGHRIGVGRIILPAVIMHGSFDAILLGINVFIETSWDTFYENGGNLADDSPPYNPVIVNVVAWISITLVLLSGILWYYRENRNQRARLIVLEEKEKANENGSLTYTSPKQHASEVELV